MASKKYYRTKEVAEILNISEDEVRRRLNCGELIGHKSKRRQRWLIDTDQFQVIFSIAEALKNFNNNIVEEKPVYRFIKDIEHEELFSKYFDSVEESLYIATANFKTVHLHDGTLVTLLNKLCKSGVDVRVLCAKLQTNEHRDFECIVCPRNHMKMFIFDERAMYIGSANLTPAAIEDRTLKTKRTNNHEAGIFTTDEDLIAQAIEQFVDATSKDDCSLCTIKDCEFRSN